MVAFYRKLLSSQTTKLTWHYQIHCCVVWTHWNNGKRFVIWTYFKKWNKFKWSTLTDHIIEIYPLEFVLLQPTIDYPTGRRSEGEYRNVRRQRPHSRRCSRKGLQAGNNDNSTEHSSTVFTSFVVSNIAKDVKPIKKCHECGALETPQVHAITTTSFNACRLVEKRITRRTAL